MKKLVSLFLSLALLLSVMSFAAAEDDMTLKEPGGRKPHPAEDL